MEMLTEHTTQEGVRLGIEEGLLKGVKILGPVSKNGREYPQSTIQRAANLYEGVAVNVDHVPSKGDQSRSYKDRMGHLESVRAQADGLYADFRFNPEHALAKQLAWDAANAPGSVGFSHNVQGKTKRRGDVAVVEEITRVQSVDLVADPATTRGLFEATETDVEEADDMAEKTPTAETLTEAQLREQYPDFVKGLVEQTLKLHADSSEQKAILQERDTLKEKLAKLEEQAEQTKKRETVLKLCEEAKLEKPSDTLIEACLALDDAEKQKVLIEHFATGTTPQTTPSRKPISRDQSQTTSGSQPTDAKTFVEALTG